MHLPQSGRPYCDIMGYLMRQHEECELESLDGTMDIVDWSHLCPSLRSEALHCRRLASAMKVQGRCHWSTTRDAQAFPASSNTRRELFFSFRGICACLRHGLCSTQPERGTQNTIDRVAGQRGCPAKFRDILVTGGVHGAAWTPDSQSARQDSVQLRTTHKPLWSCTNQLLPNNFARGTTCYLNGTNSGQHGHLVKG